MRLRSLLLCAADTARVGALVISTHARSARVRDIPMCSVSSRCRHQAALERERGSSACTRNARACLRTEVNEYASTRAASARRCCVRIKASARVLQGGRHQAASVHLSLLQPATSRAAADELCARTRAQLTRRPRRAMCAQQRAHRPLRSPVARCRHQAALESGGAAARAPARAACDVARTH